MPYLTDLADACRKSGLKVVEQPGWRNRGHAAFTRVSTIVCHHTAGPRTGEAPSLNVVTHGRPGLAGPLSQIVLGRSGTVYVVAAGVAWHAGATWTAAQGNYQAIGIEAEATGVDTWPGVQYDAYARLCRALIDHYRLPVSAVQAHKEICKPRGRKIDPNFDMNAFRAVVGRVAGGPAPTPAPKNKVEPAMIYQPVGHGADQYFRLPAMVGKASALYGRAWVSFSARGGMTGRILPQVDTDRNDVPPAGAGGPTIVDAQNGSRNWSPLPSGTEYIECFVTCGGPGFIAVEFEPYK